MNLDVRLRDGLLQVNLPGKGWATLQPAQSSKPGVTWSLEYGQTVSLLALVKRLEESGLDVRIQVEAWTPSAKRFFFARSGSYSLTAMRRELQARLASFPGVTAEDAAERLLGGARAAGEDEGD